MLTVQLKGGVGNQLYQIAAVHSLARRNGVKFVLNLDLKFGAIQGFHPSRYKDGLYRKIELIDLPFKTKYKAPSFRYQELPFFGKEKNVVYSGYLQSWKYFDGHQPEINELFAFKDHIRNKIEASLNNLRDRKNSSKIVGVHVRRGDYYRYPKIFNIVGKDYYNRAKEQFELSDTIFLHLTSDHRRVKDEFDFDDRNILAPRAPELTDLCTLSLCDSIIMGNSTYSAWGAYLGNQKEKVICPGNWFAEGGPSDEDLVDPDWTKI